MIVHAELLLLIACTRFRRAVRRLASHELSESVRIFDLVLRVYSFPHKDDRGGGKSARERERERGS